MFSYVSAEDHVPAGHPMRPIRGLVDRMLARLDARFEQMYSGHRSSLNRSGEVVAGAVATSLYSVRSERVLMEQLAYNLLFRRFVGMNMDEEVWVPTVFSKNRDRLLPGDVAEAFFDEVLAEATQLGLLSDEHFTVDGTLIEAWAGLKNSQKGRNGRRAERFRPRECNGELSRRQTQQRTHASTTDADALLARKGDGKEAKLSYGAHVLMESRNGLVVNPRVTLATGACER